MGKKTLLGSAALVVIAIGSWLVFTNRPGPDEPLELTANAERSGTGKAANVTRDSLEPGWVIVGGVKRPASDVRAADSSQTPAATGEKAFKDPHDYGRLPEVPGNLNPHTKSVLEAARTKTHPERLSLMIPPEKFDPEAYAKNPAATLDTIGPGRAFATAQPGPGVPQLAAITPRLLDALQGDATTLQVKAVPGSPVTFVALDAGAFENQLSTITVRTGADGVAEAAYTATSGVIDDVNILVGSPQSSGQIHFIVHVSLPGSN